MGMDAKRLVLPEKRRRPTMNKMRKHRSRPLRTGAVMAAAVMLGIIDGYGKANMYKVNKILKRRIRDGFCLSSGRSHTCCGIKCRFAIRLSGKKGVEAPFACSRRSRVGSRLVR